MWQFPMQVCFSAAVGHSSSVAKLLFSSRDLDLQPSPFEPNLNNAKLNQYARHLNHERCALLGIDRLELRRLRADLIMC